MAEKPILTPRHQPFTDPDTGERELPVYAVRRGQARLGRDPVVRNLTDYAQRETWQQMAEALTQQYFPRSVRDDNTATLAAVQQLYLYALIFYPRQFRLKGTYRPDWTRATLLSWFRRSVRPATRQWWAVTLEIDEPTTVEQSLTNAIQRLRLRGADDWLTEALTDLDDQAQDETRRGELARLIYLPVALSHLDEQWRERTGFDAPPKQREILRVRKQGTAGYVRRGRTVWLVADRYVRERLDDLPWVDLREGTLEVWDYRLSWQQDERGEGIHIEIQPEVIEVLRARLKSLLNNTKTPPQHVLHQINSLLERFIAQHRWATGAGRQLFDLDRWLYQQVRGILMPRYSEAGKRLTYLKNRLSTPLVLPRPNLFLDPQVVSEEAWRLTFNPYR